MTDKILISNDGALAKAYGADKRLVDAAIQRIIIADKQRGLDTAYVAVDDNAAMRRIGAQGVTNISDQHKNKEAVDAAYNHFKPDYIVLIGGPAIIPHVDLQNPVYSPPDDPDNLVPSDLPYSCSVPFSTDPGDFVGPSRVVSRLPDLTGSGDSAYFVSVLDHAAQAGPRPSKNYSNYLGVSAKVWDVSTKLSLKAIFGKATNIQDVPPKGHSWTLPQLHLLSHFFNCHGAPNDHRFYGQKGSSFPTAHDASYLVAKIQPGSVVAAECCYGAELYTPSSNSGQMCIANTYLQQGAYGFFGSTTIAYGPAKSNANADLICQFFFQEVLRGRSIGHAGLLARQRFAGSGTVMSPTDLKTLAQFIVLGDASVHCIAVPPAGLDTEAKWSFAVHPPVTAEAISRKERRVVDAETGMFLAASKRVAVVRGERATPASGALAEIAARVGMGEASVLTFALRGGSAEYSNVKAAVGARAISKFHVIIGPVTKNAPRGYASRLLEVNEASGEIVAIRELFSH